MCIHRDVPITMDDGLVLRADIFRSDADGRYRLIMTHGLYAKGLLLPAGGLHVRAVEPGGRTS